MNLYKMGQKNLDMKIFEHGHVTIWNKKNKNNKSKRAIDQTDLKPSLVLLRKNTDVNFSEGATTHVG